MTPKGGAYSTSAVLAVLLAALVAFPGLAPAQQAPTANPPGGPQAVSGILMLDWERLYERSAWGRRVAREIAQESSALNAENNRIADDLIAEEKSLTERRATMAPADFRTEADAFDQRATGIRAAQKAKAQALSRRFEDERQGFVEAAVPLLDRILAERGAALVIDRRTVIRGLAQADITDEMATLVDAELGDGADRAMTSPPATGADPAPGSDPGSSPEAAQPGGEAEATPLPLPDATETPAPPAN